MSQGYSSNNSYQGRPTLCPAVQAGRYHYDGQVWWRNGREEVEWFVHCWETWNWRFYSSEEQADIGSLGCHLSLCDAHKIWAKDQVWVLGSPEALVCVQVWDRIACHDCNQMSMVWASTRGHAAGFIFIWVAFADTSGQAVIQAKLHPGAMSQFVAPNAVVVEADVSGPRYHWRYGRCDPSGLGTRKVVPSLSSYLSRRAVSPPGKTGFSVVWVLARGPQPAWPWENCTLPYYPSSTPAPLLCPHHL